MISFWFGSLDAEGMPDAEHKARWWKKDPDFDGDICMKFLEDHRAVKSGEREDWLADARGRLGYVIVLDQFSRNMFRGTPDMFSSDPQAVATAHEGIDCGDDEDLLPVERVFLYMPLMHSEDLADQDRCVSLFSALVSEAESGMQELFDAQLKYSKQHRDIIKRFGRFPHRNEVLGRDSTDEEKSFLSQPGSSF